MEQHAEEIKQCKGCGADILWLTHDRTGNRAPIDAYPDFNGNVLIDIGTGTYHIATAEEKAVNPNVLRHSHFTTCPFQQKFRTRGRK